MWKVVGVVVLAVSIAGGCANSRSELWKASDEQKAEWLEDWSEWRGVVLPDVAGTEQKVRVKTSSVDAVRGRFELSIGLLSEEDKDEELVWKRVEGLATRFCDAWWESSPVVMSGIEEFGSRGGEDWKLLEDDHSFELVCSTYQSFRVVSRVVAVESLLTEEWPEWRAITVRNENESMKQTALAKAVWKEREQWTFEVSVRIESGWIGIPDKWVRVGLADDMADDFCRNIAGKPSWLLVSHAKKPTREDNKLVRQDHVLVYQCEDVGKGSAGAFAPDRIRESAPSSG